MLLVTIGGVLVLMLALTFRRARSVAGEYFMSGRELIFSIQSDNRNEILHIKVLGDELYETVGGELIMVGEFDSDAGIVSYKAARWVIRGWVFYPLRLPISAFPAQGTASKLTIGIPF